MKIGSFLKAGPLALLSGTEMFVPFLRVLILSHLLNRFEFGFAAALTATYSTIEQMTDAALYRFVLASPRDRFREALATSQGIALFRGVFVAVIILCISYPVACGMTSCGTWTSFGWLALLPLIKSCENFELRVMERDYKYGPQLTTSIISNAGGVIALIIAAKIWKTHEALLVYMFLTSILYVIMTHVFAKEWYRLILWGDMTPKALRFSYPLMLNGAGNAIMTQGDRLIVGAMLGVEALGHYAVIILAAYVPATGMFRLLGPLFFAGLVNSASKSKLYFTRLRLFSCTMPIIAAFFAIGWITFSRTFLPIIFGHRFTITNPEVLLIAIIYYLRICRSEPATALFIQSHSTVRLAIGNNLPFVGLILGALFLWKYPAFTSMLFGTMLGEAAALAITVYVTRPYARDVWPNIVKWSVGMCAFPTVVGVGFELAGPDIHFGLRLIVGAVVTLVLIGIFWVNVWPLFQAGYDKNKQTEPNTSLLSEGIID